MGASEDVRIFQAPNRAAAEKLAAEIMEQDRYENGHEYSGTIGMANGVQTFTHPKPLTRRQASMFIFGTENAHWEDARAQKWGPAILVNVRAEGARKRTWMLGAMCSE